MEPSIKFSSQLQMQLQDTFKKINCSPFSLTAFFPHCLQFLNVQKIQYCIIKHVIAPS